MTALQSIGASTRPAPVTLSSDDQASRRRDGAARHQGRAIYHRLVGCDPAASAIEDDISFDRHILASILAVSAMETGPVAERAGLSAVELTELVMRWFPAAVDLIAEWMPRAAAKDDEEAAMVRDLLIGQRSSESDVGIWLAAMIARRAMEPNHLWEDLGLRDRAELTRLLGRHFAPLAARNINNMRWKRFFYRMLCEDDGLVMCTTPICTECNDFNLCFGEENGESRMAVQRRRAAVQE